MNQAVPAAVDGSFLRLQHRPEDLGGGEADRDKRLLGPGAGDEGAERLDGQTADEQLDLAEVDRPRLLVGPPGAGAAGVGVHVDVDVAGHAEVGAVGLGGVLLGVGQAVDGLVLLEVCFGFDSTREVEVGWAILVATTDGRPTV